MGKIIAILFEKKKEDSYIAIELEGKTPEVLLTKGPSFEKWMGPYPPAYAEATFNRWNYAKLVNPPEVNHKDKNALKQTLADIHRTDNQLARYRQKKPD